MSEPAWSSTALKSDGIRYYVATDGSDSNDGLTTSTPFLTANHARDQLRDGHADQIVFKRGQTFTDGPLEIRVSGESYDAPIVIGAYGTGAKPIFTSMIVQSQHSTGDSHDHILITELTLKYTGDVQSRNGVSWLSAGDDIRIEDVTFDRTNVEMQSYYGVGLSNVQIIGCHGWEAFINDETFIQQFFIAGVTNLTIRWTTARHGGWREDVVGSVRASRSHNFYLTYNVNVVFEDNITAQASATGVQSRKIGSVKRNLVLKNPIGILLGHFENADQDAHGTCSQNVVLDGDDLPGVPLGVAIWAERFANALIEDNVMSHQVTGTGPAGVFFDHACQDATVRNNVVYKWGGIGIWAAAGATFTGTNTSTGNQIQQESGGAMVVFGQSADLATWTFSTNKYHSTTSTASWFNLDGLDVSTAAWPAASGESDATYTAISYSAPERTIEDWDTLVGGDGTLAHFMAQAEANTKGAWNTNYDATKPINWIRGGLDLSAVDPVTTRCQVIVAGGLCLAVTA